MLKHYRVTKARVRVENEWHEIDCHCIMTIEGCPEPSRTYPVRGTVEFREDDSVIMCLQGEDNEQAQD